MDSIVIPGIIATLICSFFFSGIEIAFLSSNKLQIELQGKQGSLAGQIMSFFIKRQSWFIGTTLIGNTVALVYFGNFMAQLIVPMLTNYLPHFLNNEPSIMLIHTFLATMLILFSAEFLPKSLFMINPNIMLNALAIPFAIIFILLFPLMIFIVSLSKFVIIYILRLEYSEEKPVFALTDLNNYFKSMQTVRHENEDITLDQKIFDNALEFKSVRVRECMIPRTEIIGVESSESIETLRNAFVESGHSKIIIYKETIDEIIGYSHSSALFKKPSRIEEILTPIIIVPETTLANELMIRFINQRKSLAVVVDEFGGTSGIVSMEDVIEEIFGEIEDEHDEDDLTEQKLDDNTYLLSARLEIDYLNETYSWTLPTGEYETLSGLILSHTEDLPEPGETFVIDPYTITIQSTLDNRIDTVKLTTNTEGATS
jgi:putative hemolysin